MYIYIYKYTYICVYPYLYTNRQVHRTALAIMCTVLQSGDSTKFSKVSLLRILLDKFPTELIFENLKSGHRDLVAETCKYQVPILFRNSQEQVKPSNLNPKS